MILTRGDGNWSTLSLTSPHQPSTVVLDVHSASPLGSGTYTLDRVAGEWKLAVRGTGRFLNYFIPDPASFNFLNTDDDLIIIARRSLFTTGGKMALLASSEGLYELIQSGDTTIEVISSIG